MASHLITVSSQIKVVWSSKSVVVQKSTRPDTLVQKVNSSRHTRPKSQLVRRSLVRKSHSSKKSAEYHSTVQSTQGHLVFGFNRILKAKLFTKSLTSFHFKFIPKPFQNSIKPLTILKPNPNIHKPNSFNTSLTCIIQNRAHTFSESHFNHLNATQTIYSQSKTRGKG